MEWFLYSLTTGFLLFIFLSLSLFLFIFIFIYLYFNIIINNNSVFKVEIFNQRMALLILVAIKHD